jgi:hypothetical protein
MLHKMRRLYPRGAANRGICVDAEGAMLGRDCILVSQTHRGFHAIDRNAALLLQKCLSDEDRDDNWLFRQCQRIADALNAGEVALAQIYGLRIPLREFDLRYAEAAALAKAGFNPNELRIPKGDPHGGEWTAGDGQVADQVADVPMNRNKDDCIAYCYDQTEGRKDNGGDPFWACLRACQGKFRNPLFPEFNSHFD